MCLTLYYMIAIDSSSLILLAKLSILDKFLQNLKTKLVITDEVGMECILKSTFDAKIIKKRIEEETINKKRINNRNICNKIMEDFNIGKGEAETIALCLENKLEIITDDKKAINACRVLKIKFTTIPNILVEMCRKNIIAKSQTETYAIKLEGIGRYKKEIMKRIKGDIKNDKNE